MAHGNNTTSVLVIGDDLDTASFLESSLSTIGFEVTMVQGSMQALEQLRAKEFNVILCEFSMPKMGGEEFYAKMEREVPWALPNLCFLSSDANSSGMQAFLARNNMRYLEKPFTFDQLAGVVNEILSAQPS
jgi:DNA-binding NtrC family response regulator